MPLPEQNIERELALTSLAIDLRKHPEKAFILALNHYENHMNIADNYRQLRADFEKLQQENIRLKASGVHQSPLLPAFLNSSRRIS